MKLIFATGNKGKIKEAQEILTDFAVVPISDYISIFSPAETGTTFLQNAIIKAEAAHALFPDIPVLADDSGLAVDVLDGSPGIFSSRFAGEHASDSDNRLLLLRKMSGYTNRSARFVCSVVLLFPDMRLIGAHGTCEGKIAVEAGGENGFGYDPVFVPEATGGMKTMAELTSREKHAMSHRGAALRKLEEYIKCLLPVSNE